MLQGKLSGNADAEEDHGSSSAEVGMVADCMFQDDQLFAAPIRVTWDHRPG